MTKGAVPASRPVYFWGYEDDDLQIKKAQARLSDSSAGLPNTSHGQIYSFTEFDETGAVDAVGVVQLRLY